MGESLVMMPWFPRDFLSATRGWTITEKGVYRELLDAQWELGALPADPEELRRLIGATDKEWAVGWKRCAAKFGPIDAGLRNERLEQHRSKSLDLVERRRKGARSTNAKRWQSDSQSGSQSESLSERSANRPAVASDPSPSEEKIKTPAARAISTDSAEPQDPDDYLIWTAGIELLGESKRSLMGKLVQQHGRDLLARKLGELMAMTEKPRDPAAYLIGVMRKLERRFQP